MIFEKNDRIVLMGDSVTDFGRAHPVGEGLGDSVGTGWARIFHSMINAFYPEMNIRITNMGSSGNNIIDLKNRWQTDCLDLKPDWVNIFIGINDVWRYFDSPDTYVENAVSEELYEKTYRELIEKTLPNVKGITLMTPYYMEPNPEDTMRAMMDRYGAIVKKLAKEYNLLCVDLQAMFNEYFKVRHSMYITWDSIHPNQVGAVLIANEYLKNVGFDYKKMM